MPLLGIDPSSSIPSAFLVYQRFIGLAFPILPKTLATVTPAMRWEEVRLLVLVALIRTLMYPQQPSLM